MKTKVIFIFIIILSLATVGLYEFFNVLNAQEQDFNVLNAQEQEIKSLQGKINDLLAPYPQLAHLPCRLEDIENEISLVCATEGGFETASGSYDETYNKTGVLECARDNCTFYKYPEIPPIKKSKDITIIRNDGIFLELICNVTSIGESKFNYTVLSIESLKKETAHTEENCLKLSDLSARDYCEVCNGKINKDSSFCEKVTDKDQCYRTVAPAIGEVDICNKIQDSETKNFCLKDIAYRKKDSSICYSLGDDANNDVTDNQNNCVMGIAVNTKNATLCGQLTKNSFYWNDCFKSVAGATMNASICENINDSKAKLVCVSWVENKS